LKILLSLILVASSALCFAENEGDTLAIQHCLQHWQKHPFTEKNPPFRTISSSVRVLGVGAEIRDDISTPKPELILLKPSVTVLAKSELHLRNPNGWYCLKANVAVLGKSVVDLHCKANLASSKDGATILGSGDQGSVTVLGESRVDRTCN
jgi:hypothetical protein